MEGKECQSGMKAQRSGTAGDGGMEGSRPTDRRWGIIRAQLGFLGFFELMIDGGRWDGGR
jgi:hypothetical protein